MTQLIVSIFALFSSLTLLIVGNGMLGTLLAIRLDIAGINTSHAGWVLALYSVGFVVGSIYGAQVVKRVGHIRSFATFAAVATAAILIHPLHISVLGWMLLRLIVGFCIAGLMLVTESWVNARATPETRGTLLAVYMVIFYLAAASGQFLLAAGDPGLHHLFLLAAILVAISLVPISLTRSPAPEIHESPRMRLKDLWAISPVSISVAVLSGVVLSAFSAVGPIYGMQVGLESSQVGSFMGTAILAAMVFQWPVAKVSDHLPRGRVIFFIACASIGAGFLISIFGSLSTVVLFATVALFYGLSSCLYALNLAFTHDLLETNQIVPASSALLFAFGIGTIIGPLSGAWALALLGPGGLFLFLAAVLGLLAFHVLTSVREGKAPNVEDQSHCVGVNPISTPVLLELDPRNEYFATGDDQVDPLYPDSMGGGLNLGGKPKSEVY